MSLQTEKKQEEIKAKILLRDNEEYKIVKRLPKRFPKRTNDIYITTKTDFNAQSKRCEQLLIENVDFKEIYLHAMGAAINRAISLALQLQSKLECQLSTLTSTIELEDDLIPLIDDLNLSYQYRNVSAVHIKLFFSK
jgi:ribonuclease P/MRP protein subunit RPP20